jgi:hypothetical protein
MQCHLNLYHGCVNSAIFMRLSSKYTFWRGSGSYLSLQQSNIWTVSPLKDKTTIRTNLKQFQKSFINTFPPFKISVGAKPSEPKPHHITKPVPPIWCISILLRLRNTDDTAMRVNSTLLYIENINLLCILYYRYRVPGMPLNSTAYLWRSRSSPWYSWSSPWTCSGTSPLTRWRRRRVRRGGAWPAGTPRVWPAKHAHPPAHQTEQYCP